MQKEAAVARLEHYISVGRQRLRCGYTTGTCAAAAARGAADRLLTGCWAEEVRGDARRHPGAR